MADYKAIKFMRNWVEYYAPASAAAWCNKLVKLMHNGVEYIFPLWQALVEILLIWWGGWGWNSYRYNSGWWGWAWGVVYCDGFLVDKNWTSVTIWCWWTNNWSWGTSCLWELIAYWGWNWGQYTSNWGNWASWWWSGTSDYSSPVWWTWCQWWNWGTANANVWWWGWGFCWNWCWGGNWNGWLWIVSCISWEEQCYAWGWGWWWGSPWAWCYWGWWGWWYCGRWWDASSYWSWWGGGWYTNSSRSCAWWYWCQWVLFVRYPASCWYSISGWDCCYECNWYCVHIFTSDWTLSYG